jgi:antitoxin ParD1/3/4
MNVSLTPELEALVNEKVRSGLYQTASEVVREALRLLKNRDDEVQRAERQALLPLPPVSIRSRQGSGRKPRSRARSPRKRG